MSSLLEVKNISRSFGGLAALSEVSFDVNQGEIVGVIGPNGAGKTTLFNVITGFFPPKEGHIIFNGEDITKLKPHQVSRKGVIRTFQADILFRDLSVKENVLTGLHIRASGLHPKHIFYSSSLIPKSEAKRADELLEMVGLSKFKDYKASELPHGHQRMLGIAVALAAEPKLLLLDEPVTGMNLEEIGAVVDLIHKLRAKGLTILIVEHHIKTVMDICQRVIVLSFGKKIAEGSPEEVRRNEDVVEAYLGPEEAA